MTSLATLEAEWDQAAREDAMFNIITDPARANGGWTPEEFFAHGQVEIDAAMARLDRLGVDRGNRSALDFGCGIGRLTHALAAYYRRAHGVDTSGEMIRLAREHAIPGTVYHHKLATATAFDLVYSRITLQHMPPDLQRANVQMFLRVLKPGGVAMFDVPDGPTTDHNRPWLRMYGTLRATVEKWIAGAGGTLVDVEATAADSPWTDNRYVVTA